jgi:hypothetical protein
MKRRKAVIKKLHQKESTAEAGQSRIGDGSRVFLTHARVFFFLVEFVLFRIK